LAPKASFLSHRLDSLFFVLGFGGFDLPVEIKHADERVAEVRLICDQCSKIIATCLMRKEQVEAKKECQVICQNCKQQMNAGRKKETAKKSKSSTT
jgi:hypothetical protein